MVNYFKIFVFLGLCLASFSTVGAQDRLERRAKKVAPSNNPVQVLQDRPTLAEAVKKRPGQFINFQPRDKSVVTTSRPTFRMERDLNKRTDQGVCDKSDFSKNAVKLTVVKTGTAEAENSASVVLEKIISIAPDCRFEISFSELSLEDNTGYAWSVSGLKDKEDGDRKWNSFFYTTHPIDQSGETKEPHLCEKNHIADASLLDRKETAWQMSDQALRRVQPAAIVENGHEDGGAMAFESPREVASQNLVQSVLQSERYQMNLSVKNTGKHDFQIKVFAFNGALRSLTPSPDVAVVAVTGNIQPFAEWMKVTLPTWTATGNFDNLAIVVSNAQGRPVSALIDRVCLSFSSDKSCGPSVDMADFGAEPFDVPDTEPVETEFEYLAGSVSDIYPNQETQSTDWYEAASEEVFQCTSVGGSFADGQEEDIDGLVEQLEAFTEANAEDLSLLADLNVPVPDESTLTLPTVGNVNDEKCTARIVDPSRPFSGRDVVYVHGLQKDALEGYQSRPPKFTGRWPADKAEFNTTSGEYFQAAAGYWRPHISAGLQNWAAPTNSYLIANWSTNQHIPEAVNAILTQVSDAMTGRHVDGVTQSATARSRNQCFGDNGIVFVTHSTGGLVVSSMFGYIEMAKNDPSNPFHISQDMYDKMDGQIGFNAAYGGSPIASAGLATHSASQVTHVMGDAIRDVFGSGPSSGAANFDPFDTVMADLGLPQYVAQYKSIMALGRKPTLMVAGTLTGASAESNSQTGAELLIRGYNDGVLSSWVQTNHRVSLPKYEAKNKNKLLDMSAPLVKATSMYAKGKTLNGPFRYYVTPYLAPSGMLQAQSVEQVINQRSYLPNHYPIIQTSGDHFDNVNKLTRNATDYYRPISTSKRNNEESNVVHTSDVYNQGLMDDAFGDLTNEWVRKKTWGFNFAKVSWVLKEIKLFGRVIGSLYVPKLSWHYYEYTLWQRNYHLLKDYETKRAVNYVYDYAFKD